MNVMLTCAGRRNYLVKSFQEALKGRGQVFAADACADAPALRQADKSFLIPSVDQAAYIDTVFSICQQHHVLLLISLNDLELQVLAKHISRFREVGTIPVISSSEVVDTCFDKWKTFEFLKAADLETPNTYLSLPDALESLARGEISFPLVVKPRWGTASIGIEYSEDYEELDLDYARAKKRLSRTILRDVSATDSDRCILIQKRLCGQEYGLDIVNDLEGHYVCTFVKRKLAMRAGETDRATSVESDWLEGIGEAIGRQLGHVGLLDCDAIVIQHKCYVLDMNPRFGGGYPFSHIAGANLPAVLLAWANREQPHADWLKVEPNITASKCDGLVMVDNKPRTSQQPMRRLDSVKDDSVLLQG